MIQFNLLPDVKLEYIRAMYRRRIITIASAVVSAAFLAIFILLFLFVKVNQPRHLSHLDRDINKEVATLKSKEDIDKILTIQNQLSSLPALHDKKIFGSRLFDYLSQLTPTDASISQVEVDFEAKTISLQGTAKDIVVVNKFVDTLKYTDYKVGGDKPSEGKAFSSVVLQSFNIGAAANGSSEKEKSAYSIVFSFNEAIFTNTAHEGKATANDVTLIVPNITTTNAQASQKTGAQTTPVPVQGGNR